jgi:hypothetical protein
MREIPPQHPRRSSHNAPRIKQRTEDDLRRTQRARPRLEDFVQRPDGVLLQAGGAVGELDESFGRFRFGGVEDDAGFLRFGTGEEGGLEGRLLLLLLVLLLLVLLVMVMVVHTRPNRRPNPALPTRARSHHTPDPQHERSMIHGHSVKVSQAGLLEPLSMAKHLASMPDRLSRLGVLGPGADLRVDAAGLVLTRAAGEELDVVEGDVQGHHEEFEDEGDFGRGGGVGFDGGEEGVEVVVSKGGC